MDIYANNLLWLNLASNSGIFWQQLTTNTYPGGLNGPASAPNTPPCGFFGMAYSTGLVTAPSSWGMPDPALAFCTGDSPLVFNGWGNTSNICLASNGTQYDAYAAPVSGDYPKPYFACSVGNYYSSPTNSSYLYVPNQGPAPNSQIYNIPSGLNWYAPTAGVSAWNTSTNTATTTWPNNVTNMPIGSDLYFLSPLGAANPGSQYGALQCSNGGRTNIPLVPSSTCASPPSPLSHLAVLVADVGV